MDTQQNIPHSRCSDKHPGQGPGLDCGDRGDPGHAPRPVVH